MNEIIWTDGNILAEQDDGRRSSLLKPRSSKMVLSNKVITQAEFQGDYVWAHSVSSLHMPSFIFTLLQYNIL